MAASLQFLLSAFFFLISFSIVNASNGAGFSVNMFHRDSPHSPLYNPSQTHYQRLAAALRRSVDHALRFNEGERLTAGDTAAPPINNNRGEYLMEISLGTPPVPILAIADTGSDIIWTQCLPCVQCFSQSSDIFDPSKSRTYKNVPCSSPRCSAFGRTSCSLQSVCQYLIRYGDGSQSSGDIAIDTVTMDSTSGRPVSLPKLAVGCGHNNGGNFQGNISGIIGLGRGAVSLVKQMGSLTGGKFSYCLAPISADSRDSGRLNFGANAVVSGAGTVSTPIVGNDAGTFYWLILEGVSVGNNRFEFPSIPTSVGGNMIIDSGTTITILPLDFYQNFASSISDEIKLQPAKDPNQFLDFCFSTTTDDINAPIVTFHFRDADVRLNQGNVFIRVADDVLCLAFVGADNGTPIYGNIAQTDFIVGYDTQNLKVSFKHANCAAA